MFGTNNDSDRQIGFLVVGYDFGSFVAQARLGTDIPLHAFPDLEARVAESVRTVRESDLVPDRVTGLVYEVETGRLREVA